MTYYIYQDWLEEYSGGGNPGNGGGQRACENPQPPWWCGLYDEDPGYNEPPAQIDSFGYSMLIVFLITVVVWTKFFDKSK